MNRLPKLLAVLTAGIIVPLAASAGEKPLATDIILSSIDASSGKIVQLAGAFSADQYDWAPAEGVRSVKDAIIHVAGANYWIAGMLGHPAPEGLDVSTLGEGASKDEIIAIYKASVEHAKAAVAGVDPATLSEEIDLFGQKAPRARLMLVLADHGHEHLGQLIAYARTNGVVPPWSM